MQNRKIPHEDHDQDLTFLHNSVNIVSLIELANVRVDWQRKAAEAAGRDDRVNTGVQHAREERGKHNRASMTVICKDRELQTGRKRVEALPRGVLSCKPPLAV